MSSRVPSSRHPSLLPGWTHLTSLSGDCPSAPGVFVHNGWQTLAFIFNTVLKVNGICHIPSWLALMWGDFPLLNDRCRTS